MMGKHKTGLGSGLSRNGERAGLCKAPVWRLGEGCIKKILIDMPEKSFLSHVFKDEWELVSSAGV